MKDFYNYNENINITKNQNGQIVMKMNKQILTLITNHLYDAAEYQKEHGYEATAKDTMELWRTLIEKEGD